MNFHARDKVIYCKTFKPIYSIFILFTDFCVSRMEVHRKYLIQIPTKDILFKSKQKLIGSRRQTELVILQLKQCS